MVRKIILVVLGGFGVLLLTVFVLRASIRRFGANFMCESAAVFTTNNRWYDAFEAYDLAVTIDPTLPAGWIGRGESRLRRGAAPGDVTASLADLNQALVLEPDSPLAYDKRGAVRLFQGDIEGAIADATQAIKLDPALVSAWIDRGDARMEQADDQSAIDDYTQALQLSPRLASAYASRAYARFELHDGTGALRDADKAVLMEPRNAAMLTTRATLKLGQLDVDGALSDCEEALRLEPRWPHAYASRADAQIAKGNYAAALADCDQAIDMAPNQAGLYTSRALVKRSQGDEVGAAADCAHALELDPHNASTLASKAAVEYELGHWQVAADTYLMACQPGVAHQSSFAYYEFFAWLARARLGQKQAATADLRAQLEHRPLHNPWPQAIAAYLLGQQTQAGLLKLAADPGERCEASFYVGCSHLLAGDVQQARSYFAQCVATHMPMYFEYRSAAAELDRMSPKKPQRAAE